MRRYKIVIEGFYTWDSYPNGKNDPNAQQVEFQLLTYNPSILESDQSTCTIYGVAWEQINQQANLVGKHVQIYGGMAPGLPLATHQSQFYGLIADGEIFRCWGNWIGTEMSLGFTIATAGTSTEEGGGGGGGGNGGGGGGGDSSGDAAPQNLTQVTSGNVGALRFKKVGPRSIDRVFEPQVGQQDFGDFGGFGGLIGSVFGDASQSIGGGSIMSLFGGGMPGLSSPLNFIHNLMPNMPLSSAIQETLSRVFPGVPLTININSMLQLGYQDAGVYQNFPQYASFIKDLSHSIMGTKSYSGVNMTVNGKGGIDVWDHASGGGTQVTVYELIGQPTWINVGQVQFTTVMRSDIYPPQVVYLPKNIPYNVSPESVAPGSRPPQRTELSFTGAFQVVRVTQNGDFRNPDGVQWSTTYECNYLDQSELSAYNASQNSPAPSTDQAATDNTTSTPQQQTTPQSRLLTRSVRRL